MANLFFLGRGKKVQAVTDHGLHSTPNLEKVLVLKAESTCRCRELVNDNPF